MKPRRYSRLYEKFGSSHQCFYCGQAKECIDHRPPSAVFYKYGTLGGRIPLVKVDCCNNCNHRLAAKVIYTLQDAVRYLREELQAEKNKARWTDTELAELGYSLRTAIKNDRRKDNKLNSRIAFLQKAHPYPCPEPSLTSFMEALGTYGDELLEGFPKQCN